MRNVLLMLLCLMGLSASATDGVSETGTVVTITLNAAGTLREAITSLETTSVTEFTIIGPINASDIKYLRTGQGRLAHLTVLNLAGVTLVAGEESYNDVWDERTYYIADKDSVVGNIYYSTCLAGAFSGMSYEKVVWPETLDRIGARAFYASPLKTLEATNLKRIDAEAFWNSDLQNARKLESIDLSSVEIIENGNYFSNVHGNADGVINIGKLQNIPDGLFSENKQIKEVFFSPSLKTVGASAFYNCENIERVTLPTGTEIVGDYAFSGCSKLAELNLSEGLLTIDDDAFQQCALSSVVLPEGLETIGSGAFSGCSQLVQISLPTSLLHVHIYAFSGTPFEQAGEVENNVLYLGTVAIKYVNDSGYKLTEPTTIVFREGTTVIADYFAYSYGGNQYHPEVSALLQAVVLPSTLRSIGAQAFWNSSITGINLAESLVYIGEEAFRDCKNLMAVNLPSGLKHIGVSAFGGCSLISTLTIPEELEYLGGYAFAECSNLLRLNYRARRASAGGYSSPFGSTGLEKVQIGPEVEQIPDKFVAYCDNLFSVSFDERPSDMPLSIGSQAFQSCSLLKSIHIPGGDVSLGNSAFQKTPIETLLVDGRITSIGDYAFNETKLTTFEVGDGCLRIGECAFQDTPLTHVTLPETVEEIGNYAFYRTNLTDVVIPDGVQTIGTGAFAHTSLTEVIIPDGVRTIGNAAFAYTTLQKVVLGRGVESLGWSLFSQCWSLKVIRMLGDSPVHAEYDTFSMGEGTYLWGTTKLKVPMGALNNYKQAAPWKNFEIIREYAELTPHEESFDITFNQGKFGDGVYSVPERVIGNVYYDVDYSNGDYVDIDYPRIKFQSSITEDMMADYWELPLGEEDFCEHFNGIAFAVPAGESSVTLEYAAWGQHSLVVKPGRKANPIVLKQNASTETVTLNLDEADVVFIYPQNSEWGGPHSNTDTSSNYVFLNRLRWDSSVTSVDEISTPVVEASSCYTPDGRKVPCLQQGLNILQMSDGTVRKVFAK